jgi:hypothetical protein
MVAKLRKRRAYLKKKPAGKFNPYLFRDIYGRNDQKHEPDAFDDVEPDPRLQRAWIKQEKSKTQAEKTAQLKMVRTGHPQDIWYKISLVNWPTIKQEIWFSGKKYKFREWHVDGSEKWSVVYPSKETLMSSFRDGNLIWDIKSEVEELADDKLLG